MVTHSFTFPDAHSAARFVFRLHKNLSDIATFRDGVHVRVFDASDRGHAYRIGELARESSGTYSSS